MRKLDETGCAIKQGRNAMKPRLWGIGLGLATIALGIAAAEAADRPLYGVVLKTLSNPYWNAMEQGVEAGAKKAGVDILVQAVESESATEAQLNTCNTTLERKPTVLLTSSNNTTILLPCLKAAGDAGILVADLDINLDAKVAAAAGVKLAFQIGSDNYLGGIQAGEWLVAKLGKDAKGPVLVIEGLAGNPAGSARAKGFAEALAKGAPGLTILGPFPGDWDRQKAANITNDALTRNPNLVAIFCSNDTMALGAVEVLYGAGKKDIPVIGFDGTSDAVKSINDGRLAASVAQLPFLTGQLAIETAQKVLAGGTVDKVTHVPTLVLTKQLFDEKKDPMLQYLR